MTIEQVIAAEYEAAVEHAQRLLVERDDERQHSARLAGALRMLGATQTVPHSFWPVGHAQAPAWQKRPPVQTLPQAPQLSGSHPRGVQVPSPQSSAPATQS